MGDAAQVRTDEATLFLRQGPDGWLVQAAGCEPAGEEYECELRGR